MEMRICEGCGEPFSIEGKPWRRKSRFCGLSCSTRFRNREEAKVNLERAILGAKQCLNCDHLLVPREGKKLSQERIRKFCSKSCAATYNNTHKADCSDKTYRVCKGCDEKLLLESCFYRVKGYFQRTCKACKGKSQRKYRSKPEVRERLKQESKEWRETPRGKRISKSKELSSKFGITLDDYAEMLESQNNGCAVCGGQSIHGRMLSVDHCHETGKIRGLLCLKCNTALGYLNDSEPLVVNLLGYIRDHS